MDCAALDIAAAESRLAAHGSVVTPQRRAILGVLAGPLDHPTATQVYDAVTIAHPATARATVYNTLSLLRQIGLVHEVLGPDGDVRHDANTAAHHPFVCVACGRRVDVSPSDVTVRVRGLSHHRIDQTQVVLRGTCADG